MEDKFDALGKIIHSPLGDETFVCRDDALRFGVLRRAFGSGRETKPLHPPPCLLTLGVLAQRSARDDETAPVMYSTLRAAVEFVSQVTQAASLETTRRRIVESFHDLVVNQRDVERRMVDTLLRAETSAELVCSELPRCGRAGCGAYALRYKVEEERIVYYCRACAQGGALFLPYAGALSCWLASR